MRNRADDSRSGVGFTYHETFVWRKERGVNPRGISMAQRNKVSASPLSMTFGHTPSIFDDVSSAEDILCCFLTLSSFDENVSLFLLPERKHGEWWRKERK